LGKVPHEDIHQDPAGPRGPDAGCLRSAQVFRPRRNRRPQVSSANLGDLRSGPCCGRETAAASTGAKLTGQTARDYLHSSELIVAGLRRANELYQPDGLPIVFDLQLEAEVLGCGLRWAEQTPPSVCTHPLEQGRSLLSLPVFDARMGRFPLVMDALRTLKQEIGDEVAMYGLLCGPFTLALHLLGNGSHVPRRVRQHLHRREHRPGADPRLYPQPQQIVRRESQADHGPAAGRRRSDWG